MARHSSFIALAVLLSSAMYLSCGGVMVSAATFYQLACTDAACSVGCVQQLYVSNRCYSTYDNMSATSWCDAVNGILHQHLFYTSMDCSGPYQWNPITLNTCYGSDGGPYNSVEYACGASSSSSSKHPIGHVHVDRAPTLTLPVRRMVRSVVASTPAMDSACGFAMDVNLGEDGRTVLLKESGNKGRIGPLQCSRADAPAQGAEHASAIIIEVGDEGRKALVRFGVRASVSDEVTCSYSILGGSEECVMRIA